MMRDLERATPRPNPELGFCMTGRLCEDAVSNNVFGKPKTLLVSTW